MKVLAWILVFKSSGILSIMGLAFVTTEEWFILFVPESLVWEIHGLLAGEGVGEKQCKGYLI